jgi:kynurenine formamidase
MEYLDLSHPLEPGPGAYPGDPAVEIEPHATHEEDGYRVTRLAMGSHSGTHVDAPNHLVSDGPTLDDYPIETFAFDAVRVSIPDLDPRQPITRSDFRDATDLPDFDSALREADLVAAHTGWDAHWGSSAYLDHPYLAPVFAGWLADRECHVGIDAISVDPTPTGRATPGEPDEFPAHRALLGADRLVVENLTGLSSVPERFTLLAFPLAVPDADGAPVRAVARLSE